MKKYTYQSKLVLLVLGILMITGRTAHAQVDKAMKYAWYFDYEKAEKYLMNEENKLNPEMVLQLAEALYAQGKYAQALYYYKIAESKRVSMNNTVKRNYVHSSTMMREKSPFFKKSNYFSGNYFLYTTLDTFAGNSKNEDFGAFYWNNLLFVTTSRMNMANEKSFDYSLTKMPFLDVYPFTEQGSRVPYPAYLPKTINTKVHDGPICISKDTNLIVLTRNYTKANAAEVQNLYLVYFVRDEKKHWSAAIPIAFCKPGFSVQHPVYSETEKTLYFSSDMPGGHGGFDLYASRWTGKEWAPPMNLGDEINSEYDEVFPGFTPEGELMYASNHIETTGGLDIVIFSHGKRYLLNEPFNTIYDDFGMTYKNAKEGYFSSNRFSNKFDDNIYHFKLSEPARQTLYVKVMDKETGAELDQVKVNWNVPNTAVSGEVYTHAGRNNILIADTADARKPLNIYAYKDGYFGKGESNSDFVMKEGKLVKEIYIQMNPVFAADDKFTMDNNQHSAKPGSILTNDQINGMPVKPGQHVLVLINNPAPAFISIDAGDGSLKVNSGINPGVYTLDYALCNGKALNQCDTGKVYLTVQGIYEYQNAAIAYTGKITPISVDGMVVTNDTGYTTVNGGYVLNVRSNDWINGKRANMKNTVISNVRSDHPEITLNRKTGNVDVKKGVTAGTYHLYYDMHQRANKDEKGEGTVTIIVRRMDQIPGRGIKGASNAKAENATIYFNNDEPRPYQLYKPAYNYQNAFESYMKVRKTFYENSADSKTSLDTFFTIHVEGGFRDMNRVMEVIQARLNQGVQVEISISAYCSPIASTEYNNKLSTRRIVAVTRYYKKWNEGALKDAIESNRITFWEHAVGELEAPKDVNADYDKVNESVYGIKASRERRVSISVKIISVN